MSANPSTSSSSSCKPLKRIEVVAALIIKEGRVFATQRGWREIAEELSCTIDIGPLLDTLEWDYPEFHLTMHCFLCTLDGEAPHLNEHEAARWLSADELFSVRWLPADLGLLPKLSEHL